MVRSAGDVRQPRTGKVMKPTPLDGQASTIRWTAAFRWPPGSLAREPLLLPQNIVNRYMAICWAAAWSKPIDDLRATIRPAIRR